MKIINTKSYKTFRGKYVRGKIYNEDTSGYLVIKFPHTYVRNGWYCEENGTYKQKVNDIKLLAKLYTNAYKELLTLNKKLKTNNEKAKAKRSKD